MDKDRNRTAEGLSRMLRGRQTTVPTAEQRSDRKMEGPPSEPLEQMIKRSLGKGAWTEYCFTGAVSEQQLREDGAMWFAQAPEYVERVAMLRDQRTDLFPDSPCTGTHLRARLQRSRTLEQARDEAQAFVEAADRTLKVERADLIGLADMHVAELDSQSKRPLLPEATRTDLMRAADFPLKIWRDRVQKMQATRRGNEKGSKELADAEERAKTLAEAASPSPGPSARVLVQPPPPPPGRDGKRPGRSRPR